MRLLEKMLTGSSLIGLTVFERGCKLECKRIFSVLASISIENTIDKGTSTYTEIRVITPPTPIWT